MSKFKFRAKSKDWLIEKPRNIGSVCGSLRLVRSDTWNAIIYHGGRSPQGVFGRGGRGWRPIR